MIRRLKLLALSVLTVALVALPVGLGLLGRPPAKAARHYGWTPPKAPPAASTRYSARHAVRGVNPPSVDLRPKDTPVYDQGDIGSCTGNGWGTAVAYHHRNTLGVPFDPSRLWIYWQERDIEGTVPADDGAAVADGAKVVSTLGVAPESDWPYDATRFRDEPPPKAYLDARAHVLPAPSSIDNATLDETRTALASGHPVVFGFLVRRSFEDVGRDGVYRPRGPFVGGHCVVAVGYDDVRRVVICKNSWGTDWGADGYFHLPYAVYTDTRITSDCWTIAGPPTKAAPPDVPGSGTITVDPAFTGKP